MIRHDLTTNIWPFPLETHLLLAAVFQFPLKETASFLFLRKMGQPRQDLWQAQADVPIVPGSLPPLAGFLCGSGRFAGVVSQWIARRWIARWRIMWWWIPRWGIAWVARWWIPRWWVAIRIMWRWIAIALRRPVRVIASSRWISISTVGIWRFIPAFIVCSIGISVPRPVRWKSAPIGLMTLGHARTRSWSM